jgi:hypothetical protein
MKTSQLSICANATISESHILWRSLFSLTPNLSIIGNVPKSAAILILNSQEDIGTLYLEDLL